MNDSKLYLTFNFCQELGPKNDLHISGEEFQKNDSPDPRFSSSLNTKLLPKGFFPQNV